MEGRFMSKTKIGAITFDLWDTVIIDDSDEPKREAQGLASKPVERRNLVEKFLAKHAPVSRELVDVAFNAADAAFRHVWYEQNVTWTVRDRLSVVLKGLGRELPEEEFAELIRLLEEMELQVQPDFVPGVHEAVRSLGEKYKLGVISDAIFSPGRALRELLEGEGILDCFQGFVLSDEIGCSKPDPRVFEEISRQLDVPLEEIVHIGDREPKDVDGPHNVGAKAILFTGALDRGSENTKAEAICSNYKDLEGVLESLE
jgi:putative hydrolase of the HAD superfamily